jgi:alkylation response protein AidB-like acyl-CoA dehydrogenase
MSEAGSGSDAFSMRTTAEVSSDASFYVEWYKLWISNKAGVFLDFLQMWIVQGYRALLPSW